MGSIVIADSMTEFPGRIEAIQPLGEQTWQQLDMLYGNRGIYCLCPPIFGCSALGNPFEREGA